MRFLLLIALWVPVFAQDVLVSAELLALIRLPANLQTEPLPMLSIRGRAAPLAIAALSLRVGQDQV